MKMKERLLKIWDNIEGSKGDYIQNISDIIILTSLSGNLSTKYSYRKLLILRVLNV